jgi:hypothetical protein
MAQRKKALTRLRDSKGNVIKADPEVVKRSLEEVARIEKGEAPIPKGQ